MVKSELFIFVAAALSAVTSAQVIIKPTSIVSAVLETCAFTEALFYRLDPKWKDTNVETSCSSSSDQMANAQGLMDASDSTETHVSVSNPVQKRYIFTIDFGAVRDVCALNLHGRSSGAFSGHNDNSVYFATSDVAPANTDWSTRTWMAPHFENNMGDCPTDGCSKVFDAQSVRYVRMEVMSWCGGCSNNDYYSHLTLTECAPPTAAPTAAPTDAPTAAPTATPATDAPTSTFTELGKGVCKTSSGESPPQYSKTGVATKAACQAHCASTRKIGGCTAVKYAEKHASFTKRCDLQGAEFTKDNQPSLTADGWEFIEGSPGYAGDAVIAWTEAASPGYADFTCSERTQSKPPPTATPATDAPTSAPTATPATDAPTSAPTATPTATGGGGMMTKIEREAAMKAAFADISELVEQCKESHAGGEGEGSGDGNGDGNGGEASEDASATSSAERAACYNKCSIKSQSEDAKDLDCDAACFGKDGKASEQPIPEVQGAGDRARRTVVSGTVDAGDGSTYCRDAKTKLDSIKGECENKSQEAVDSCAAYDAAVADYEQVMAAFNKDEPNASGAAQVAVYAIVNAFAFYFALVAV